MSLEEEAALPFDFSSPLQIYPGEIPQPILQRAVAFTQTGCPEQEAVVRAMQELVESIGDAAASGQRPQQVA